MFKKLLKGTIIAGIIYALYKIEGYIYDMKVAAVITILAKKPKEELVNIHLDTLRMVKSDPKEFIDKFIESLHAISLKLDFDRLSEEAIGINEVALEEALKKRLAEIQFGNELMRS